MIKSEYIAIIRKDNALMGKLMLLTGKTPSTIYRWLQFNKPQLTTSDVLSVICEHLEVSQKEILEPRKKVLV